MPEEDFDVSSKEINSYRPRV